MIFGKRVIHPLVVQQFFLIRHSLYAHKGRFPAMYQVQLPSLIGIISDTPSSDNLMWVGILSVPS